MSKPVTSLFEGYHVTATAAGRHVDFRVVCVCCWDVDADLNPVAPASFGPAAGKDVEDPARAEAFLEGYVKWDGCSNWKFSPQEPKYHLLHFCGRNDAEGLGRLMGELYRLTEQLLPTYDREAAR